MLSRTLNWLSITSGSLIATLLLITSAQAADTILASKSLNSTLELGSNSKPRLVAVFSPLGCKQSDWVCLPKILIQVLVLSLLMKAV